MKKAALCAVAGYMIAATSAFADIKIGAVLSLTGPAASLGAPARNVIDIMPREIDGEKVVYIILDDASDPSTAVRSTIKLINEERVDAIIGPSVTPTSLAILETAAGAKTPFLSLAGGAVIAHPVEGARKWAFKNSANESDMAITVYRGMKARQLKTVSFIGFNDAYGDSFIGSFKKTTIATPDIEILSDERYSPNDTSVTAQVLSTIANNPDAVIIGSSGTPGLAPIIELRNQGYEGQIYIGQAMANPDVLRVGGKVLDGIQFSSPPVMVAEQLPDRIREKNVSLKFIEAYESKYGPGSRNITSSSAWDSYLFIEAGIRKIRKDYQPGTAEFRVALRDAIENLTDFVGLESTFTMTAENHYGQRTESNILVEIRDGNYRYVPQEENR